MIKGILFDKDGTLVDFFSLWLHAALEAIPFFLQKNQIEDGEEMRDYVLSAIGVTDGMVDPKGGLAYKSYHEIAGDICGALQDKGICVSKEMAEVQLKEIFNSIVANSGTAYQVFTDMEALMKELKSRSIAVGLATADTMDSAENCLKAIGVREYFDYVGADDGIRRSKPEPDMFLEFLAQQKLMPAEIAVVGDAYNDMIFAKRNGGIAVGVQSGVSQTEDFSGEADYVIASIHELPGLLDRI